ncbi:MAG: hypothetical protein ACI4OJ_01425, partial [Lachnospiraceae bacterium]
PSAQEPSAQTTSDPAPDPVPDPEPAPAPAPSPKEEPKQDPAGEENGASQEKGPVGRFSGVPLSDLSEDEDKKN